MKTPSSQTSRFRSRTRAPTTRGSRMPSYSSQRVRREKQTGPAIGLPGSTLPLALYLTLSGTRRCRCRELQRDTEILRWLESMGCVLLRLMLLDLLLKMSGPCVLNQQPHHEGRSNTEKAMIEKPDRYEPKDKRMWCAPEPPVLMQDIQCDNGNGNEFTSHSLLIFRSV